MFVLNIQPTSLTSESGVRVLKRNYTKIFQVQASWVAKSHFPFVSQISRANVYGCAWMWHGHWRAGGCCFRWHYVLICYNSWISSWISIWICFLNDNWKFLWFKVMRLAAQHWQLVAWSKIVAGGTRWRHWDSHWAWFVKSKEIILCSYSQIRYLCHLCTTFSMCLSLGNTWDVPLISL